jgi:hypothetical protein
VLDAGTAAELALTSALKRYLAVHSSDDVAAALMDRSRMLQPLTKLVKELNIVALPQQFQQRVTDPRNKAVHGGMGTSKGVAEKAIASTSELLQETHPLSDFGFPAV